jgi:hypothetical protein
MALNTGQVDGKENNSDFTAGLCDTEIVESESRKAEWLQQSAKGQLKQARRLQARAREITGERKREYMEEGVRLLVLLSTPR